MFNIKFSYFKMSVEANRRYTILFVKRRSQKPVTIHTFSIYNLTIVCMPLAKLFVIVVAIAFVAIVVCAKEKDRMSVCAVWAYHIKALEAHCICLLI